MLLILAGAACGAGHSFTKHRTDDTRTSCRCPALSGPGSCMALISPGPPVHAEESLCKDGSQRSCCNAAPIVIVFDLCEHAAPILKSGGGAGAQKAGMHGRTGAMEIVLATRNKKKVEEIRRITQGLPITVLSLDDFPHCPEVVEDRDTFEGNAAKKAVEVAACTGKPALSDDSGLEVDALGGAPGVFSARYDPDAQSGNDARNYRKLLNDLTGISEGKRTARFVCCIALAFPDGTVKTFFGRAEGRIGHDPRGERGFGYDPVFIPEGYDRTFAEMAAVEKDALSHRGKAIERLAEFLRTFLSH